MNVWLLPSAFHPSKGGVEEATLQLARQLAIQGNGVLVVTNRHPRALATTDLVEGVQVIRVPFTAPRAAVRPAAAFPFSLALTLGRLLRVRPKPDLLHVQCVSTQTAAAIAFATAGRLPLVVTTQGETEMDAGRIFEESAYMRTLLRASARRAAKLTACSAWAAASAAKLSPRFASAEVIPNGIDLAQWSPSPRPDARVVVAWGRHVPQKGFDLLFDAWPRVLAALPDARLLLGGTGPEFEALRGRAPERTTLVGSLERAGVSDLLEQARVAVVPSRLEPFGIVSLEAMAAGRPVVWSTRGGMSDAMNGFGWPVDPTDTETLARSIIDALVADVDPLELRNEARRFSWANVAGRYLQVYEAVLS